MNDMPLPLRAGSSLSGWATLELTPDMLMILGKHSYDRTSTYRNISGIELTEDDAESSIFPNAKKTVGIRLTFFEVPVRTGLRKRDPNVPDSYYLTEDFSFDLDQREEVFRFVSILEERRKSANS